jgi:hypothetical protein
MDTALTIAIKLAEYMAANHEPPPGLLQADSPIMAADAVSNWITKDQPEQINFFNQPAWDINSNPSPFNAPKIIAPNAIGASLAGINFLVYEGKTLDFIAQQIKLNPRLQLDTLYGDGMWDDFWYVWKTTISPALAPNNLQPNDDPFQVWGLPVPAIPDQAEELLTYLTTAIAKGTPKDEMLTMIRAYLAQPPSE